jgi:peptide/nickel transport system substrate-binding protein
MWAFDRSLPQLPYDQAQAAALLAQAGWRDTNGDGILDRSDKVFAFDLLYPAANTLRRQMALLIQADLARLGIKVRPVQVEFTSLISRSEAGDFDAVLWVWEEATKIDLTSTWSTPSPGQGSNNFIGYSNPEVDRLIAVAREEPDYTRAKVLLDRIQEAIVADQPVTFLYEANRLVATSRRLEGADINAAGVFFNIDDWYWSR